MKIYSIYLISRNLSVISINLVKSDPDIEGKKVIIVGDILHSRVALSNIYCLQKLGAEVMVCGPTTLIPKYIHELGVKVEHNLRAALEWCDVANMLRIQLLHIMTTVSSRYEIRCNEQTCDH